MEIYFSPEVINEKFHILNVVDNAEKAVGTVAFMFDEKKVYVYGILEKEGVGEDFKDLVQPYIKGLSKAVGEETEIYSCLYVGCNKVDLNKEEK